MWKILFMSHSRRNVCDGKNYRGWSPQTTWNWRMEAVAGSPVWHDEYIDRPSVDSGIHLLRMMKFSSSWNGYFFKNMHHIPVQSCTLTFTEQPFQPPQSVQAQFILFILRDEQCFDHSLSTCQACHQNRAEGRNGHFHTAQATCFFVLNKSQRSHRAFQHCHQGLFMTK